jgi:SAM-dependent methyltransferase
MHEDSIRDEFTHQTETFARAPAMLSAEALGTIVELVPPDSGARWLEVACGPAAIGRTLASRIGSVHGVDLTPAMIEKAQEEAAREGLDNAEFSLGDATALGFEDASFDGAVTDRAAARPLALGLPDARAAAGARRAGRARARPGAADSLRAELRRLAGPQLRWGGGCRADRSPADRGAGERRALQSPGRGQGSAAGALHRPDALARSLSHPAWLSFPALFEGNLYRAG